MFSSNINQLPFPTSISFSQFFHSVSRLSSLPVIIVICTNSKMYSGREGWLQNLSFRHHKYTFNHFYHLGLFPERNFSLFFESFVIIRQRSVHSNLSINLRSRRSIIYWYEVHVTTWGICGIARGRRLFAFFIFSNYTIFACVGFPGFGEGVDLVWIYVVNFDLF